MRSLAARQERHHRCDGPLSSLRVHLLSACNLTCGFCHHEGAAPGRDAADVEVLLDACEKVRAALGTGEVHLTGGEPTMHPRLAEIVRGLVALGFRVKLTTNAACAWRVLDRAATAGLAGVNVSLHAVTAPEFVDLMGRCRWDPDRARRVLSKQLRNLTWLIEGGRVPVKVNTVVGRSGWEPAARVHGVLRRWIRERAVRWRVMDDLDFPGAGEAIAALLHDLGAEVTGLECRPASSSTRLRVRGPDGAFAVKLVRRVRDRGMCARCPVDRAGGCLEGVYGLRLELIDGVPHLRRCIHLDAPGRTLIPVVDLDDPDTTRGLEGFPGRTLDAGPAEVLQPFVESVAVNGGGCRPALCQAAVSESSSHGEEVHP